MNLKIHWISGGIGPEDPLYIGKAPDPRLATWGGGQLTQPAQPQDTTLFFRPDPGVQMPFRLPGHEWWKQYTCPPMIHAIYDYEIVHLGNELIRVGSFADTDREVWRLENCRRGLITTDPAQHAAGARVRGLVTAYGQNALPDNDSTLLEEIARKFAEFLNRCGISHTEYDGADQDVAWQDGQEHGAISPRQFLKSGSALTLVIPFPAQQPKVILRVLWGFNPDTAPTPSTAGSGADRRSSDANFDYTKLAQATRAATGAPGNVLLQPSAEEIRNHRDKRIEDTGDALTLSTTNPLDQPVYEENSLPEWSRRLDMSHHRGLGLWVTGDGSQAILLVQISGGDYVVPIDFTGRRYIEIPHSQVAWAEGRWGWRMGSKHAHYETVHWIKMGFGMLPPQSSVRVTVEGLSALREVESQLKDPVLHFGSQSLTLHGAIPSGSYLTWDGGETAALHDANWNQTEALPVTGGSLHAPQGQFTFRLTSSHTDTPPPWIDLQVLTRGTPILVADDIIPATHPDGVSVLSFEMPNPAPHSPPPRTAPGRKATETASTTPVPPPPLPTCEAAPPSVPHGSPGAHRITVGP